jgi:transposase InsO family protein
LGRNHPQTNGKNERLNGNVKHICVLRICFFVEVSWFYQSEKQKNESARKLEKNFEE